MKLVHPDPTATGCTWGRKEVKRSKDGTFDVPDEAAGDLAAHGFVPKSTDKAAEPTEGR